MKIEYQNETFKEVISEEFVSKKFDALAFQEKMRADARDRQGCNEQFKSYVEDTFKGIGLLVDKVVQKSPFAPSSADYKNLKISLLLNTINSINVKNKLNSELPTIILWKLPRSMSNYVRILLKELYTEIKKEIMECHRLSSMDDDLVDKLLQVPSEERDVYEEQY
jgi:hypothetical protein